MRMEMSGSELNCEPLARHWGVPVVFMTAHGYSDRAKSEAASDWTVAYLTRPFSEDDLLESVQTSLSWKANG